MAEDHHKKCSKCKKLKLLTDFHVQTAMPDGHRSACKECNQKYSKIYYKKNRKSQLLKTKKYRQKNKDIHYKNVKNAKYKRQFGITLEDYYKISELQNHRCAICGKEENGKQLAVDHCHETGKVRGLLCSNCNLGLGKLGDSIESVGKALAYLKGK